MRFLLDVNISTTVASFLQRNKHNLFELRKKNLFRLPDNDVIILAKKHKRIILTHDKDFINLTLQATGVVCIVIRLKNQNPKSVIDNLTLLLEKRELKKLKSGLVVIETYGMDFYKTRG